MKIHILDVERHVHVSFSGLFVALTVAVCVFSERYTSKPLVVVTEVLVLVNVSRDVLT
jgi:hypothetical protein